MALSKKWPTSTLLFLLAIGQGFANTGIVGPPQSSAGIVEKQIQKEYQAEEVPPTKEIPLLEVDIPTETLQIPSGRAIYISKIVFTGNQAVSTGELNKIAAPYIGKRLSGEDIRELCLKIQQYYVKEGFILARAFPPVQDIKDQTLTIQIMEGILGQVEIEGNHYYNSKFILSHVKRFVGKAINYNDLIRALLLLNENMELSVGSIFKKGKNRGEADLILVVKDQLPLHIYTDYNNYGSEISTHDRWGTRLDYGNLITDGDKVSLTEVLGWPPSHLNYSNAIYSVPLSSWGTRMDLSYIFSQFKVGELGSLDLKGQSQIASVKVKQALSRTRIWSSDVFVEFDYMQLRNEALGQTSSYDKLRILQVGGRMDYIDPFKGRNLFDLSLSAGIPDFLGGLHAVDPLCSREGAGGRFFIGNLDYQRLQTLPYRFMVTFNASGQGTFNKLPISQQFYIGGIDTVRGYPLAVVLGDNGYYMNLELSIPSPPISSLQEHLRFIAFVDQGGVFDNSFVPGEHDPAYLTSAGVGLRVQGPWNFFLNFDAGFPLTNPYRSSNCITYLKIGLKIL